MQPIRGASPDSRGFKIAFCLAYLKHRDPTKAARAAGSDEAEARGIGARLIRQESTHQILATITLTDRYKNDPRYRNPPNSLFDNVYYCCSQKTGSQWLKSMFIDPIFYQAAGLKVFPYIALGNKYAKFSKPMPINTIVTHLYVGYDAYNSIPKPSSYRTFYVLRDPRDAVVSWYYSARNSHALIDPIPQLRSRLRNTSYEDGMIYIINVLKDWGFFKCQRSWIENATSDPAVRIFRYEQMAEDEKSFFGTILDYLGVKLTDPRLSELCDSHAYSRFAQGRKKGEENELSHYRAGRAGAWREKFTARIAGHFDGITGDLVQTLGYSR